MSLPKTPHWPTLCWYVAATSDEINNKPFSRQICGERIVFFRSGNGEVAALEDFCPHRGAALSLGYVESGQLICGYHGLAVACSGKVAAMPGQRVAGFTPVRTFPVVERYGFIWIWPGEPTQADVKLLPQLDWINSPNWRYAGGFYHVKADYRLMIDNLMDLTHETYVHRNTIGQKEIDENPVKTVVTREEVVSSRFIKNVFAPSFWRMALRSCGLPDDQLVDRWQICRFSPPSQVMLEVGVALAGQGGHEADISVKASSVVIDLITPETEASHWYFFGFARSFSLDNDDLTKSIQKQQHTIFGEDLEVIEQQQNNLLRYPTRKLLKLNIDTGGVRSRLMLDRIIADENSRLHRTEIASSSSHVS